MKRTGIMGIRLGTGSDGMDGRRQSNSVATGPAECRAAGTQGTFNARNQRCFRSADIQTDRWP